MAEMLTCVLMWLGCRIAARGICLSLQIGQISRNFTIPPTTSTAGRHLGFERDYRTTIILPFGRVTSSCIKSITFAIKRPITENEFRIKLNNCLRTASSDR